MIKFFAIAVAVMPLLYAQALAAKVAGPVAQTAAHAAPPASATTLQTPAYTELIHAFLLERAAPYEGTPQVNIEPPQTDRLAPCEQAEAFLPQGAQLRSRLTVGVRCLRPQSWVAYGQANVSIEGNYYVAARALQAGSVLGTENLSQRSGDLLRLPRGAILHADFLVGAITTQRLAAGAVIKAGTLRSADSVQRGQAVRLEARGDGFVATSDGKAMQSGEPGTQIQVRTNSGQLVSGTILNAHTVLVLM